MCSMMHPRREWGTPGWGDGVESLAWHIQRGLAIPGSGPGSPRGSGGIIGRSGGGKYRVD